MRSLVLLAGLPLFLACVPHRDVPAAQIPNLGSLAEIMDVQATVADPQWSKIGKPTYTSEDWVALGDLATRIQATSAKAKDFSRGPMFDDFALRLHNHAAALDAAVAAKNPTGASTELTSMKETCKECHNRFK